MTAAQGRRPPPELAALSTRLSIFVPALMSVGFVFWLSALARDRLRRHHDRALARRAAMSGAATAAVTAGRPSTAASTAGLADRRVYALGALASAGLGVYVIVGATANYVRHRGYVGEIGWLLAVSWVLGLGFLAVGGALAAIARRWPPRGVRARAWATRLPLGPVPGADPGFRRPSSALTTGLVLVTGAASLATMLIGSSRGFLRHVDDPLLDAAADAGWLRALATLDLFGSALFVIVAATLLWIASHRCRVLLVAYPVALVGAVTIGRVLDALVERPRPPGAEAGDTGSFPSIYLIAITVLAGLLPRTIAVMSHHPRITAPLRGLAAVAVIVAAAIQVHLGAHWPSDVVASVLIGAALVLAAEWALAHEGWHLRCRDCQWAPATAGVAPDRRGAIPLRLGTARLLGLAAHGAAAGVVLLIVGLLATQGLPADPDGILLDPAIQRPVQLAFAALVSVGTLVAWRFPAVGAVVLAVAGAGLGVFAALEYEPPVAMAITVAVLIPAVLTWLSWQHQRRAHEIGGLALVTLGVLAATWVGASLVYGAVFGPTHPDSAAPGLPVDRVEWVWTGGLGPTTITAVARIDEADRPVRLLVGGDGEGDGWSSPTRRSDDAGIVRLSIDDLTPDRSYEFVIEVDGHADRERGRGGFRTPPVGPASFRFVSSGCARVGANGAVYDAIAAEDPLLFLLVGDAHYSNIDTDEPARFRAAYDRMLTQPGQAALYRRVPVAYVWDDHDYGANDADASSPSREAARSVFREAVPSHGLVDPDGAIHRAFTVGRVRFVITDTRSERTADTMLGAAQRAWLEEELVAASRTHGLVVWVNPTPWIGQASVSSDGWGRVPDERLEIADAIRAGGVDNLVMVSGDAHMLAVDDGTNSGYSGDGAPGFPVFHAAALDRPGGVKGGPYSGGTFPGAGQYGVFDVVDDGETIELRFRGKRWDGDVLIDETLTFPS